MAIRHVAVRWIPRDCPCVVPGILSQAVKRAYREATSEAPNWILIQVLLVAARMDNLEVAVDTARSLAPRLYEGDESNAPGDHLPTFYATFYDTESIMGLAATRGYGAEAPTRHPRAVLRGINGPGIPSQAGCAPHGGRSPCEVTILPSTLLAACASMVKVRFHQRR